MLIYHFAACANGLLKFFATNARWIDANESYDAFFAWGRRDARERGRFNGGFNSQAVGGFQHVDRDAVAVRLPGRPAGTYQLDKGQGYAVMAAFNHYFTPQFHHVLFGSHKEITYGSRVRNTDWTSGGIGDASQYRVGNQLLWDPAKNLEFGIEFDDIHIDQTPAHDIGQVATALPVGVEKDPTAYEVRLRVQRDF